jgi:hypothetical protein
MNWSAVWKILKLDESRDGLSSNLKFPYILLPSLGAKSLYRELFNGRYATRSAVNELSHRLSPTGMAVAVPV